MNFDVFYNAEQLEKDGRRDDAMSAYTDFITQCECNECYTVKEEATERSAQQEKLALAYNNRGFLNYLKVEFKLAVQDYTQALYHNPNMAVAYYNRGLIHYRLSRFSEAVHDLKEALTLKADFEPARMCLQQALKDLQLTLATKQ